MPKLNPDRVAADLAKWRDRREIAIAKLFKADTMVKKLEKSQRRLASKPASKIARNEYGQVQSHPDIDAVVKETVSPPPADDLELPSWLDRRNQRNEKDEQARAEIAAEIEAEKKRKAEIAATKRKIKADTLKAELTGQTRKMPLTGKAALAAIRGESS